MVPRYLVYWVNSVPSPDCALVSDEKAFEDGGALISLAEYIGGHTVPFASLSTSSEGKVHSVLSFFGDKYGWSDMPSILQSRDAAAKLVNGCKRGESAELVALLEYMFIMSGRILQEKENIGEIVNAVTAVPEPTIASELATLKKKLNNSVSASNTSSSSSSSSNGPPSKREKSAALSLSGVSSGKDASRKNLAMNKSNKPATTTAAPRSAASINSRGGGNKAVAGSSSSSSDSGSAIDMRRDTIRNSYSLRKVHSRGKDGYVMDAVADKEMHLVEEAAREERDGVLMPGVVMPVSQFLLNSPVPAPVPGASTTFSRHSRCNHVGSGSSSSSSGGSGRDTAAIVAAAGPLRGALQSLVKVPDRKEMIQVADWLRSLGIYAPVPRDYLSPSYVHPSLIDMDVVRDGYQLHGSKDAGAVFERYLGMRKSRDSNSNSNSIADEHRLDLDSTEWLNGIALSELAAAVLTSSVDRKHLVKQVQSSDNLGRNLKPRFLINGTEVAVEQKIQALRNIHVACKAIREGTVPATGYGSGAISGSSTSSSSTAVARDALLTALDNLRPIDVFDGTFPVWTLLSLIKAGTSATTPLSHAAAGNERKGRSNSRSRSPVARNAAPCKVAAAAVWGPPQAGTMANRYANHKATTFPSRVVSGGGTGRARAANQARSSSPAAARGRGNINPGEGAAYYRRQPSRGGLAGANQRVRFSVDLESGTKVAAAARGRGGRARSVSPETLRVMRIQQEHRREHDLQKSSGRYGEIVRAWDGTTSPSSIEFGMNSSNPFFHNRTRGRDRSDLTYNRHRTPPALIATTKTSSNQDDNQGAPSRFKTTFPRDTGLPPALSENATRDGEAACADEEESRERWPQRVTDVRHDVAVREREDARRHGMRMRLEKRRVEEARRHNLDVLGVEEGNDHFPGPSGYDDGLIYYEDDHRGLDACVALESESGKPLSGKGARAKSGGRLGFHWASAMQKKQHDDHQRRIKRAGRLAELGLSKLQMLQEQSLMWIPPLGDPGDLATLRKVKVCAVSGRQILSIVDWLAGLGLGLMDGEGGYYYWDAGRGMTVHHRSAAPPLSLANDRLRNGHFIASLLYAIEPEASRHAHLAALLHGGSGGRAITAAQAEENVSRSMWLLKLRRSPPVPEHLLVRAREVVQGDKSVIWSLLWELMQAYPYSSEWLEQHKQHKAGGAGASPDSVSIGVVSAPSLRYSAADVRRLDGSLAYWLDSIGATKRIPAVKALRTAVDDGTGTPTKAKKVGAPAAAAAAAVRSLAALEASVRDGTLLCAVCELALGLDVKPYNAQPRTYQQCLDNTTRATKALRNLTAVPLVAAGGGSNNEVQQQQQQQEGKPPRRREGRTLSPRFLYPGCEEHLARGHWHAILGLLEDIRRCVDGLIPLSPATVLLPPGWDAVKVYGMGATHRSRHQKGEDEGPYLGPLHFSNPHNFDSDKANIDYRGAPFRKGVYYSSHADGKSDLITEINFDGVVEGVAAAQMPHDGGHVHRLQQMAREVDPHNDIEEMLVAAPAEQRAQRMHVRPPAVLHSRPDEEYLWRQGVDIAPSSNAALSASSSSSSLSASAGRSRSLSPQRIVRNLTTGLPAATDTVSVAFPGNNESRGGGSGGASIGRNSDLYPRDETEDGVPESLLHGDDDEEWRFQAVKTGHLQQHQGVTLSHPYSKGYPGGKLRSQTMSVAVSPGRYKSPGNSRSSSSSSESNTNSNSNGAITPRSNAAATGGNGSPDVHEYYTAKKPAAAGSRSEYWGPNTGELADAESGGEEEEEEEEEDDDRKSQYSTAHNTVAAKSRVSNHSPVAADYAVDVDEGGATSPVVGSLATSFTPIGSTAQSSGDQHGYSVASRDSARLLGFSNRSATSPEDLQSAACEEEEEEEVDDGAAKSLNVGLERPTMTNATASTTRGGKRNSFSIEAMERHLAARSASPDEDEQNRALTLQQQQVQALARTQRGGVDLSHTMSQASSSRFYQPAVDAVNGGIETPQTNSGALLLPSSTTSVMSPYRREDTASISPSGREILEAAAVNNTVSERAVAVNRVRDVQRERVIRDNERSGSVPVSAASKATSGIQLSPYDHASSASTSPEYEEGVAMSGARNAQANTYLHTAHSRGVDGGRGRMKGNSSTVTPLMMPKKYGGSGPGSYQHRLMMMNSASVHRAAFSGRSGATGELSSGSSSSSGGDPTPSSVSTSAYMALPSQGYSTSRKERKKETRVARRTALQSAAGDGGAASFSRAAGVDIITELSPSTSSLSIAPPSEVDLLTQRDYRLSHPPPAEEDVLSAHYRQKREQEEEEEQLLLAERQRLQTLVREKEDAVRRKLAAVRQKELREGRISLSSSRSPPRTTSDLVANARGKKAVVLVRWLQQLRLVGAGASAGPSVGLNIPSPSAEDILLTFRDGALLCRLVEKLERCQRLPGTVDAPVALPAQRVQNVRKAMDCLKKGCAKLPVSAFMYDNDIVDGKIDAIVTLLLRLKKAYQNIT